MDVRGKVLEPGGMAAGFGASQLLASAFSSNLNCTVITRQEYERDQNKKDGYFAALDINQLFNISQVTGAVGDFRPDLPSSTDSSPFHVNVKTTEGRTLVLEVFPHYLVKDLIRAIEDAVGYSVDNLRLICDRKRLHATDRLYDCGVSPDSTIIYLILHMCGGGCPTYYIDDSLLDSAYDCDFSRKKDDGTTFFRGGRRYYRPYGWTRYALKVLGRYEDDTWLGRSGFRRDSTQGEWAVSYHGTAVGASGSIAQEGYNLSKGKRFVYGRGIYTTPSVEVAAMYAQTFTHAGQKFQLVFQNRVSDKELRIVQSPHGEYWVQPQDELVRPYGICI